MGCSQSPQLEPCCVLLTLRGAWQPRNYFSQAAWHAALLLAFRGGLLGGDGGVASGPPGTHRPWHPALAYSKALWRRGEYLPKGPG